MERKYDFEKMKYWLKLSGLFDEIKDSKAFETFVLKKGDQEIFLRSDGKYLIKGKKDNIINTISKVVLPAKLCSKCNSNIIECSSLRCKQCDDLICVKYNDGLEAREIIKFFDKESHLVLEKLINIVDKFKKECEDLERDTFLDEVSSVDFLSIDKLILSILLNSKNPNELSKGLILLGIKENLKDAFDVLISIGKKGIKKQDRDLLANVRNKFISAFNLIKNYDAISAVNIKEDYKLIKKNENEIVKIADAGYNIVKLLNKPFSFIKQDDKV